MAKFNPDFWEITIDSESWATFSIEDGIWHESEEEREVRQGRTTKAEALRPDLMAMIDEVLTDRQREIVLLHFFERRNQRQIGEMLGMSQQSVSEHLYGKVRGGRNVGGALRKLRKACSERGIDWL